jgi:hypothetical protein
MLNETCGEDELWRGRVVEMTSCGEDELWRGRVVERTSCGEDELLPAGDSNGGRLPVDIHRVLMTSYV